MVGGRLAASVAVAGTLAAGNGDGPPKKPEVVGRPVAVARFDPVEDAYRANNRGVALLEQYRAEEAVKAFRDALRLDPKNPLARVNLAIALLNVPDPDGALAAAKEALAAGSSPQALFVQGLVARSKNDTVAARTAFRRVLAIDPSDVGAHVNLGQLALQEKAYDEAVKEFRAALDAEPYNGTALYNLGIALTRSGGAEEGQKALARFQSLKETGAAAMIGQSYPEQGRYAEAVLSTGLEPGLVDARDPAVRFLDATSGTLPSGTFGAPLLFDFDGDGDLDLFAVGATGQRLLRNDSGRFLDVTAERGVDPRLTGEGALAGDVDGDGRADLVVLGEKGPALYRNGETGFKDITASSSVRQEGDLGAAALVDVDHDGDLDLYVGRGFSLTAPVGPTRLWRGRGDGTFEDATDAAGLGRVDGWVTSVVPTDFDSRRDVDLLVQAGRPHLFRNMRDKTFKDVAKDVGLPASAAMATGTDVNKDGFTDFFFAANRGETTFALSDGRGRFSLRPGPPAPDGAPQFVDVDNDGLLDLIVATEAGFRLFRNVGSDWREMGRDVFPSRGAGLFAMGDIDDDGDEDLVWAEESGALHAWRNDGGNKNRSLNVRLAGLVSNKSGVGAKVEMRAGSLRQKLEAVSTFPPIAPADIVFGLGKRSADAVRVLWPSGTVQAETIDAKPASERSLRVAELDRKPSSCPFLYAWDGTRFAFVTDFLGGGEMGYWRGPGQWNTPDPVEYVRLTDEELRPRDGRYELRVSNELEELLFLDRLRLAVVEHPDDVEIHPNEGMVSDPSPHRLFAVRELRVPMAATDEHGHDARALVARVDAEYPDDFRLSRVRGYADEHSLTLDLSGGPADVLLLTAWTDYAFSSDNVAAHQAGLAMKPPILQMRDRAGAWRTVIDEVGIPVGRTQTVAVDLAGKWLSSDRRVRLVTNMRIYYDRIRVGGAAPAAGMLQTWLDPARADLRERGFSAERIVDRHGRLSYEYAAVRSASPWKAFPGRYTREGDVRELVAATDDVFVFSKPGDEIALSFDAATLGAIPNGRRRTFLLYADGFSKEMDINSATPDSPLPLPFHGMTRYPYGPDERYPMTAEKARLMEIYNTRVVRGEIATLAPDATGSQ